MGQFITNLPDDKKNSSSIFTTSMRVTGNKTEMALYKVEQTDYYCVAVIPQANATFEAWVEWRHPYGELPAADYPKLLVIID